MRDATTLKMIAAAALWGSGYVLAKAALEGIPPFAFAFTAALFYCISLWLWYVFSPSFRQDVAIFKNEPKSVWPLALSGVAGVALYQALTTMGLRLLPAGFAALLGEVGVALMQIIFARLFFGEKLGRKRAIAFSFSVLGLALASYEEIFAASFGSGAFAGLCYVALATCCFAGYAAASKNLMSRFSVLGTLAVSNGFGVLALSVPFAMEKSASAVFSAPPLFWLEILYCGVLVSVFAYYWWQKGIKELDLAKVSALGLLIPVFSLILSIIFLNESVGAAKLVGSAVSLVAVLFVAFKKK